jgi:hypothetical protein
MEWRPSSGHGSCCLLEATVFAIRVAARVFKPIMLTRVQIAKDLLPMASNSSIAVESLEHALSRAVDGDPGTYFESKQGSSPEAVVSSSD